MAGFILPAMKCFAMTVGGGPGRFIAPALLLVWTLGVTTAAGATEVSLHPLSDGFNNRDLTISPDGEWLLTTIMAPANQVAVIVVYRRTSDGWSEPAIAPFSGTWRDIEPMFKDHLNQFVPLLLSPSNIVVKKISGNEVKCKELVR